MLWCLAGKVGSREGLFKVGEITACSYTDGVFQGTFLEQGSRGDEGRWHLGSTGRGWPRLGAGAVHPSHVTGVRQRAQAQVQGGGSFRLLGETGSKRCRLNQDLTVAMPGVELRCSHSQPPPCCSIVRREPVLRNTLCALAPFSSSLPICHTWAFSLLGLKKKNSSFFQTETCRKTFLQKAVFELL